jgi:flagellar hook-associated protein 1 FlgK
MGNLLSSLLASAGALRAFDRSLQSIQNNVSNVSTPGYARTRMPLIAMPFDPASGLAGGVWAGDLQSARDGFLERGVRRQMEYVGRFGQRAQGLAPLEHALGVTEDAAIPHALNQLIGSFLRLATAPNDTSARQQVLDSAQELASGFNQTAAALGGTAANADREVQTVVNRINELVGRLREFNSARAEGIRSSNDAGTDAQVHATFEDLSELVDFTVQQRQDGSVDILLGGGQTPLLLGAHQFSITTDFSQAQTQIAAADGKTLTPQIQGGKLAGLLELKNSVIPSFQSSLDRLAGSVAGQINATLNAGLDSNGNPGQNLFTYDPASASLSLASTGLMPADLAAASAGAPGGNGNALALAALGGARTTDGYTFSEYYGNLAASAGRDRQTAEGGQHLHEQLLAQARAVRQDVSGVSLDEEATKLIEFQRAYQASARLVTVLDNLTQTVIGLLR